MATNTINVDSSKVEKSIELLRTYAEGDSIEPLLSALETLKQEPNSETLLSQFSEEFNALGITQGAVLTYAPYISQLLSDDLFDGQ